MSTEMLPRPARPTRRQRTTAQRGMRAKVHVTQLRILGTLRDSPAHALSPVALSALLDETLGSVSYHVRKLYAAGYLDLHHQRRRRGAIEHFYKLTDAGRKAEETMRGALAPPNRREVVAEAYAKHHGYLGDDSWEQMEEGDRCECRQIADVLLAALDRGHA